MLVPEILYKISVAKSVGFNLIKQYKPLLKDSNSIFGQVVGNSEADSSSSSYSGDTFSDAALQDSGKIKQALLQKPGATASRPQVYKDSTIEDTKNEPWLIVAVLPAFALLKNVKVVSTVCRIVNIENDRANGSNMIVSLKAIARGEVTDTQLLYIGGEDITNKSGNENKKVYHSLPTNVYLNDLFASNSGLTDAAFLPNAEFLTIVTEFDVTVNKLFTNISIFKKEYRNGLKPSGDELNANDLAYKVLLRLSPLASILNILLEKDKSLFKVERIFKQVFDKISVDPLPETNKLEVSINNKRLVLSEQKKPSTSFLFHKNTASEALSKPETQTKIFIMLSIVRLYDMIVSLLPISGSQKYWYLTNLSWNDRIIHAAPQLISEFNDILLSFKDNYDLIMKDFAMNGEYKDKLRVLLNHLSTLKFVMENVNKSKTKGKVGRSSPSSLSSLPGSPNVARRGIFGGGSNGEGLDDGEVDESMKKLLSFYNDLTAENSSIQISLDGSRLLKKDFERLFKMSQNRMAKNSSEYQVLLNYLETVIDLPWSIDESANKVVDLQAAKKQLDDDHYGLFNVKNRLIEYLGVLNLQFKVNEYKDSIIENNFADGQNNNKQLALYKKNDNTDDDQIVFSQNDESKNQSQQHQHRAPQRKAKSLQRNAAARSPILCLAGPPGVGKTSLAKSVATTLGRKFQRISLGGVSDEAEIRGHRRTYVGAMPGIIISALRKAKTLNPVILLDEIDKISGHSGTSRGDPSAAMLEVLDPEQNSSFNDHYLGFPVDLSQVLFFCTANDLNRLHPALRDRMEVINLTGYNYFDKVKIVQKFLLPKQLQKNSLPQNAINLNEGAILKIITEYTHSEAGIRNLERQVSTLCRNKALEFSSKIDKFNKENFEGKILPSSYNPLVTEEELPVYLGIPNSYHSLARNQLVHSKFSERYGVVNGLSYNSDGTGGTLLFETISIPAKQGAGALSTDIKPSFTMTGKLGEVLTESIKIASSFVKLILAKDLIYTGPAPSISCSKALRTLASSQIHLHAPEGAISKDGPSAGITITLALLSLLLQKPVPNDIAMTGEMTLRGIVLPIGGVKEKILGAHLSKKIKTVLLPRSNRRDVIEDYMNNLQTEDKSKADAMLVKILKKDQENLHSCDIYDEPERYIERNLGIRVLYVEDFWDVIKAVWHNEVGTKNLIEDLSARL